MCYFKRQGWYFLYSRTQIFFRKIFHCGFIISGGLSFRKVVSLVVQFIFMSVVIGLLVQIQLSCESCEQLSFLGQNLGRVEF